MSTNRADDIMAWVYPIAILLMLLTPAIWTYQIYHWLRYREWDAIPVNEGLQWLGLGAPQFSWAGLQTVSDSLMGWPLSVIWFLLILGLVTGFTQWADSRDK